MLSSPSASERVSGIRSRLLPLAVGLISRAQESGQLRPDISSEDLPLIQLMVGTVIDGARDVEPELWRRYLQIVIQGLRADPGRPAPLEVGPLEPESVDRVLAKAKPLPR